MSMGDVTNPQQSETVISGTNKSEPLYNVFPQVAFFFKEHVFPRVDASVIRKEGFNGV